MPDSQPTAYIKFVNVQIEDVYPCIVLDTPNKDVWEYGPGMGWTFATDGTTVNIRLNGTGPNEPNNPQTTGGYFSKDGVRCWGGYRLKGDGPNTTRWDSENAIIYASGGGVTKVIWAGATSTEI